MGMRPTWLSASSIPKIPKPFLAGFSSFPTRIPELLSWLSHTRAQPRPNSRSVPPLYSLQLGCHLSTLHLPSAIGEEQQNRSSRVLLDNPESRSATVGPRRVLTCVSLLPARARTQLALETCEPNIPPRDSLAPAPWNTWTTRIPYFRCCKINTSWHHPGALSGHSGQIPSRDQLYPTSHLLRLSQAIPSVIQH